MDRKLDKILEKLSDGFSNEHVKQGCKQDADDPKYVVSKVASGNKHYNKYFLEKWNLFT